MVSKILVLKRKIKLVQLADIIVNDMNIKRNDTVMVQISLDNINLVDFHQEDLIYLLKMLVGTEGALLMHTFAESNNKGLNSENSSDFRSVVLQNDPVFESFRQMPDTIQYSSLPSESLAVWGNLTKILTDDHFKSKNIIDKNDLINILCQSKAKIIGIGVTLKDFTFLNAIGITSESSSLLSDHFEENAVEVFIKRGIPFFRINAEKVNNIRK